MERGGCLRGGDYAAELFSQGERNLDRSEGGLGIGLTLVRELVEMHGGTVNAHSAGKDQGSELVVVLPLVARRTSPQVQQVPTVAPDAKSIDRTAAGACTVLVVDDNTDHAQGLTLMLESQGYAVCTARDGPSALERARAIQPQIAILNIKLPGMDGYTLARHLRGDPDMPSLALIAVTGFGRQEDQLRARAAGFDHHFTKPVPPSDLLRAVAEEALARQPLLMAFDRTQYDDGSSQLKSLAGPAGPGGAPGAPHCG